MLHKILLLQLPEYCETVDNPIIKVHRINGDVFEMDVEKLVELGWSFQMK